MYDDFEDSEWRFRRVIPSMKTNETQCKITVKILTWSATLKQTNKETKQLVHSLGRCEWRYFISRRTLYGGNDHKHGGVG